MTSFNFIMEGKEYHARIEGDEVVGIYSYADGRYLNNDMEENIRERPYVWVAAYGMMD